MSKMEVLPEVVREWSTIFLQRSMHDFKRFMDKSGLSFSQVNILMGLIHGKNIGVSEIGEHLGVSSAAASQAIDRLVQLDLVERTEDPVDRRAKRLALTQKGNLLMRQSIEARYKWLMELMDTLTPEQQDLINKAFTLLAELAENNK
jgi:DNA-binding MarR family transcriptional regulator